MSDSERDDRRPTLQHRIEYILLRGAGLLARLLPRPLLYGLARLLGRLAFSVLRMRRRVTLENLTHAFPQTPERERSRIALASYENLAFVGLETLRAFHLRQKEIGDLVTLDREDEAVLHMALREGRGAVVVGGHYGNWELMGARISALGSPPLVIVQEQRNPLMDRDLVETRRGLGLELTGRGAGIRAVLKALQGGRLVLLLADQDAGTEDPMFIEFLGRPASTYRGPAAFAVRAGAPLIAMWTHRTGWHYRLRFTRLDAEALSDLPPGADGELRIRALSEAYVRWLEEVVRKDPTQYLWQHRRWKSRPTGEAA